MNSNENLSITYSFRIDDVDDLIFQMFTVEFAGDFTSFAYQTEFFIIFHSEKIAHGSTDIHLEKISDAFVIVQRGALITDCGE